MQSLPPYLAEEAPFSILWKHWNKARKSGALPNRSDLRLEELGEITHDLVLTDWVDRKSVMLRMTGSDVTTRVGREITGVNLLDLVDEERKEATEEFYYEMATRQCAGLAEFAVDYSTGIRRLRRAFFLPLHGEENVKRPFIGLMATVDEPPKSQDRPGIPFSADHFKTEYFLLGS